VRVGRQLQSPEDSKVGTYVTEGGPHNDRVVSVLLVVVVDLGDTDNTGVGGTVVVAVGLVLLVPVEDPSDEGGDEGDASLGAGNGLGEAEQEREVAVDARLGLELARSLDTLPGGSDLDQDPVLGDADLLVEGNEGVGLYTASAPDSTTPNVSEEGLTLALVAALSNERLASTSVETRPGTISRISRPNSTSCGEEEQHGA
jgi:hypothetical protein